MLRSRSRKSTPSILVSATVATATVTTTIAAAAAVAIALAPAFPRLCFFDDNIATVEVLIVKITDRGPGFLIVGHFYKSETLRLAGVAVHDDLYGVDVSKFFKRVAQVTLMSVII